MVMNVDRPLITPASSFVLVAAGLLVYLLFRGIATDSALDIQLHDTYFVIAQFHLFAAAILFCAACAFIHWAMTRLVARPMNRTLGMIHMIVSVVSLILILYPVHLIGASMPRKYYSYTEFEGYDLNRSMLALAILFLAAQGLFLFDLIRALVRRNAP